MIFFSYKDFVVKVIGCFYCFNLEIINKIVIKKHCVFFMVIIIFYFFFTNLFFLYIYGVLYLIVMLCSLQKLKNLMNINFFILFAQKIIIE